MKKIIFTQVIAAFLVALLGLTSQAAYNSPYCPTDETKSWRVSGSVDWLTGGNARDLLGTGFDVDLERSLGGTGGNDLSIDGGYKHFSRGVGGFSNRLDYYSLGLKWRMGSGANPARDGFFYGAGFGGAVLNSTINGTGDTAVNFEWKLLTGLNFAKAWFGELDYNLPSSVQGVGMQNLGLSVGYRF